MPLHDLLVRFGADLSGLKGLPNEVGAIMDRTAARVQKAGVAMSVGFTAPLALLGRASLDAAVRLDSIKRGLNAVAVAGEDTGDTLGRLRDIGRLPGLSFEQAARGAVNLRASGLAANVAERALRAFGNAIATTGGGAHELERVQIQLAQLSAAGKVLTRDLRPIIQTAPVVATALNRAFGTIDAQTIEEMGLGVDQFIDRLLTELEALPQVTSGPMVALENIKDSLFVAGATIANVLIPPVERFAKIFEPAIEGLANAFAKLPDAVQLGTFAFAGLLALAGPLTLVFSAISGPMLAIVAAAALLATAGTMLAERWDEVRGSFEDLEPAIELGKKIFEDLKAGVSRAMETVRKVVDRVVSGVAGIWNRYGPTIVGFAEGIWDDIVSLTSLAADTIGAVVESSVTFLGYLWDLFGEGLIVTAKSAWDLIVGTIRVALEVIKGIAEIATAAIKGDWRGMLEGIYNLTGSILRGVATIALRFVETVLNAFATLARAFPIVGDAAADAIQAVSSALDRVADRLTPERPVELPVLVTPEIEEPRETQAPPTIQPVDRQPLAGDDEGRRRKTDAEKIADIFRQLPRDISAAQAQASLFGDALGAAEDTSRLIRRAIEDLISLGLDPADARIGSLVRQYREAESQARALARAADLRDTLAGVETELKGAQREATLLGTTLDLPYRQIEILERAILQAREQGLEPTSAEARRLYEALYAARTEAARLEAETANIELRGILPAGLDMADRRFLATGDAIEYASARAAAYQQQLDALLAAGVSPLSEEVQALNAQLLEARRFETAARAVAQGFTEIQRHATEFAVTSVAALLGARSGVESLGQALLTTAGNLVAGVFDTLGNMLIQVGVTALGVGKGIAAIVKSLATLNPFLAIGAGIALLALGALVKSSLANIGKGGSSGFSGGGRSGSYVTGTYGGSPGVSAALPAQDTGEALLGEIQGLRKDVQDLRSRPNQFVGDPREFRRAEAAARENERRTDVATT